MKPPVLPLLLAACCMLCGCDMRSVGTSLGEVSSQRESAAVPSEAAETSGNTEALPPPAEDPVQAVLDKLTLKEKIYQLFIITPEQLTGMGQVTAAGETTRDCILRYPVGGLIYFSQNLENADQTTEMLSNTQIYAKESAGIGMFLAVDEEGGTVARVADALGTTVFEDMAAYGAAHDTEKAYEIGKTIAADIGGFGFNLDFAPVADVNLCPENELGSRIFSDDPAVVSDMVSGVVRGLEDGGAAATLKHFPGLGAENGDSHEDSAVIIDRTLEELRTAEFIPFRGGIAAGADFIMVGHQIVTGIGDDLPSDLSPAVMEILRNELDFEGIIISDSQQMHTITDNYSSGEAAVLGLEAGLDIILIPEDFEEAAQGVYEAVQSGRLSEERIDESVLRILQKKQELGLL